MLIKNKKISNYYIKFNFSYKSFDSNNIDLLQIGNFKISEHIEFLDNKCIKKDLYINNKFVINIIDNDYFYDILLNKNEHSLELILNRTNNTFILSYDGYTVSDIYINLNNIELKDIVVLDKNILYSDVKMSESNFNNFELITHNFGNHNKLQLISNNNPAVIILYAHLLKTCSDDEISDFSYETSIERLDKIFDFLVKHDYKPLNWNEFINWKLNNKPLSCNKVFNIIIDDFPVECYTDVDIANLFKKYNIQPGLAMSLPLSGNLKDDFKIDDMVIPQKFYYNERFYDRKEIIEIIKNEYFLVNHFDHQRCTLNKNIEYYNKLYSNAKNNNIIPNIVVYPYGDIDKDVLHILNNFNKFNIGFFIENDKYICKLSNNLLLTRYSTQKKYAISTILNKIEYCSKKL